MRRGRLLILLGLVLACGTAGIAFVLLQNVAKTPATAEIKREAVVVAVQPIAEDEVVDGRLELQEKPVEAIPTAAIRSLDDTTGMLASGPIPQDTIVQAGMIQSKEEMMRQGKLGQLVEAGFVGVAFPISELSSVSYGVQPDDRVDILITFTFIDVDTETQSEQPICPPVCPAGASGESVTAGGIQQIPRRVAQLTLQDVRVLGLGRWNYAVPTPQPAQGEQGEEQQAAPQPPQFITLMLTPQDALVLKLAREYDADIELAVRQRDDHQAFTTQQVTLDYVLSRFGITVPPKHEYSLDWLLPAPTE